MREFDPEEPTPTGRSVPNFKPGWWDLVKKVIVIGSVAVAILTWANDRAKGWLESAAFERYKDERRIQDRIYEDKIRSIETRVNETATDVKVMHVETANTQKDVARILDIVDGKRRR